MKRTEFVEQYEIIVKRALHCAKKARKESLIGLANEIDKEKADNRDIFEYGLRFLADGTEQSIIDTILLNIEEQEKDDRKRTLKKMQRIAIMMIQDGMGPEMVYAVLNSYTDIPLNEDQANEFMPPPTPKTPSDAGNGDEEPDTDGKHEALMGVCDV